MASALPRMPKPLRSVGAATAAAASRAVDEWARDTQALLQALRDGNPEVLRRLDELEAQPIGGGGGGSVTFGTPVALDVGDTTAAGVSTDAARADHVHGVPKGTPVLLTPGGAAVDGASGDFADAEHEHPLPAFGTTAGTFCEGDDARLVDVGDYVQIWMPDGAPASPHTDDDECDGSAVDGSWTEWDEAAYVTVAANAAEKHYSFTGTGNGNTRWAGLYKAIPNSVFSITAKVSWLTESGANGAVRIGVFTGDLATPSTGDVRTVHASNTPGTAAPTVVTDTYDAYNGAASAGTNATNAGGHRYLRLRCNGTTCASDRSEDGLTWQQMASVTLGFTPAHAGVCFRVLTSGLTATAYVHWIRFRSGAGADSMTQTRTGRLVRVPIA